MIEIPFRSLRFFLGLASGAFIALLAALIAFVAWTDGSRFGALGALAFAGFVGFAMTRFVRNGYVVNDGALGRRNGLTGNVLWIELDTVELLAAGWMPGRAHPKFLTLWVPNQPFGAIGTFFSRLETSGRGEAELLEPKVGKLYPFSVSMSMLGNRGRTALWAALAEHGFRVEGPGDLPVARTRYEGQSIASRG